MTSPFCTIYILAISWQQHSANNPIKLLSLKDVIVKLIIKYWTIENNSWESPISHFDGVYKTYLGTTKRRVRYGYNRLRFASSMRFILNTGVLDTTMKTGIGNQRLSKRRYRLSPGNYTRNGPRLAVLHIGCAGSMRSLNSKCSVILLFLPAKVVLVLAELSLFSVFQSCFGTLDKNEYLHRVLRRRGCLGFCYSWSPQYNWFYSNSLIHLL